MPRSRREGMPCHPLFLCVYQYQSCHRSLINIYINLCGLENNISILEKTERERAEKQEFMRRDRGVVVFAYITPSTNPNRYHVISNPHTAQ